MITKHRQFGKYDPVWTAEYAYHDGHESGLTWKNSWVPGGPFNFSATERERSTNPDWAKHCDATVENNRQWLKGWKDGLTAQNPNHPLLVRANFWWIKNSR